MWYLWRAHAIVVGRGAILEVGNRAVVQSCNNPIGVSCTFAIAGAWRGVAKFVGFCRNVRFVHKILFFIENGVFLHEKHNFCAYPIEN